MESYIQFVAVTPPLSTKSIHLYRLVCPSTRQSLRHTHLACSTKPAGSIVMKLSPNVDSLDATCVNSFRSLSKSCMVRILARRSAQARALAQEPSFRWGMKRPPPRSSTYLKISGKSVDKYKITYEVRIQTL